MSKLPYLLLSLVLIVADQISKWALAEHVIRPAVPDGGAPMGLLAWYLNTPPQLPYANVEVTSFFNVVMVWNKGISFGLFNHHTDYGPQILIALALAITLLFLYFMTRIRVPVQLVAIAMVIGGAIGNVIDRVRFGAVADFFDFHVMGWHWPAFNIADSCIVLGVLVLLIKGLSLEPRVPVSQST